ncbi:MAG: molecular chaperone GrpE [Verrucomicrobiota bacterium]|jgi:molecular chaperone GrpE
MKKVPMTESQKEKEQSASIPTNAAGAAGQPEEDDPMAGLQADLDRFRDLALRSQADFENYKKRCAREKEDAIKYANGALLERLLPVVDNFELGLSAARGESDQSPVLAGMKLVLKQINDLLMDSGLQPIDAVGHKFDPNLHEAIAHEPSATVPENNVIRQMRRGYRFKDRLLRPSSVVVSSGPVK